MSKVNDAGDSENLEKSRKNKNLKPYETRNFTKDLENQSKTGNQPLTSKGRETSPTSGFVLQIYTNNF